MRCAWLIRGRFAAVGHGLNERSLRLLAAAEADTQKAFLNCWNKHGTASINTPGIKGRWSLKPTNVAAADLFALRSDARAEYHKRRFGISGATRAGEHQTA